MCVLHDFKGWWEKTFPPPPPPKVEATQPETKAIVERTLEDLENRLRALETIRERV